MLKELKIGDGNDVTLILEAIALRQFSKVRTWKT